MDNKSSELTEFDLAKKYHEVMRQEAQFQNESAVSLASVTLKSLLLLNGGAAVAMLGFVASAYGGKTPAQMNEVAVVAALQWFATGAGTAVLAAGLSYIVLYLQVATTQSYIKIWDHPYSEPGKHTNVLRRVYAAAHVLTVLLSFFSLGAFARGVWVVSDFIVPAGQ